MKLLELMQKCDYITDSGSLDVEIKDVIYDSHKGRAPDVYSSR